MRIVHAAAELFPYAKTGGLADMVGSLATTLAGNNHDVSVFLPGYRVVTEHVATRLAVPMGALKKNGGEVWAFSPQDNLTVYIMCNDPFFDRSGIYGTEGRDYDDNHQRFMWFSRGVIEAMHLLGLKADILHCHDWQTALLPMLLRHHEIRDDTALAKKTVFTIHNLAFQGSIPIRSFDHADFSDNIFGVQGLECYGQINMVKGGILFADQVTTVSPQYAREIQTTDFGCGLEGVIATQTRKLVGLLNGIDPAVWNPQTDVHLPVNYSADNVSGKSTCRSALLREASLEPEYDGPVFGMICRLTQQKGLDLLLANASFFLGECRLIILGSGDIDYESALDHLARTAPEKICFCRRFDEKLSHLIEAGSDFFLMPSLYEPCGLNQMYSQAYGTIPLVSQVGGLLDTVIDADEQPEHGTGLTFRPTAVDFRDGLVRATALFSEKPRLAAVQQRGMRKDFSWATAASAYERIYTAPPGLPNSTDNDGRSFASPREMMAMAIAC